MKRNVIISIILVVIMSFTFACCKSNDGGKQAKIDVWTASGVEKLLKDVNYSSRYTNKTLKISAFQNEYESAQIMISSSLESGTYTIQTADLTNKDGDKLLKSAFEVYHEKYISVTSVKDTNSPTGVGMYPDALLPMEKAVEYKENKLTGENQGVWITVKVPSTQPAGVYSGSFTVSVDGTDYNVPVSVTVYDYELSNKTNMKTSFAIDNEMLGWGELDTSVEIYEKYYEFLLQHRVSGQHLPGNELTYVLPEGENLERFLYYADKYTKDERCSSFNLPFNITTANVVENGVNRTIRSVDFENFEVLLREMAIYSAENDVNLFEKASTYFIFFDEYDLNDNAIEANYNLNKAVKLCEDLAEELVGTLGCKSDFEAVILDSLANIRHKVVGSLTEELDVEKAVVVPLINKYHTEESRETYNEFTENCFGEDGELWAYTCLSPRTPNPTYHIEDVLISSRLMSWMMYDYDIVGNLYWMTNLYSWRESVFGDNALQDYYDTALRYPDANGDGFLLYPGRPYGIDGPVGSVRLQSIRDGIEEYDLMYALEEKYIEEGVSKQTFDNLIKLLTRDMYSGTALRLRDGLINYFEESRGVLASLLELSYNAGVVVESFETLTDSIKVTFSANEGVELSSNGDTLTADSDGKYTVEVVMSSAQNYLNLTAKTQDSEYDLALNLGGRSLKLDGATLYSKTTMVTAGSVSVDTIGEEEVLKISYSQDERFIAQMDVADWNVDTSVNMVTLNVYLYGDTAVELKILSKAKTSQAFIESAKITLNNGWNKIEIPVTAFNCDSLGKLTTLRFNLESTVSTEIAIGEIAIGG